MMKDTIVIGIAGGSASGKTTIANCIYEHFKGSHSIHIIRQDDYYKDQSHLSMSDRVKTNYDHPSAFDTDLLLSHINDLKNKKSILKPTYDYKVHNRSDKTELLQPRDVIIIEGLFVLHEQAIRECCDMLVYVDTDDDVRFIRRLKRDMIERGRSLDSVVDQYLNTVKIMHKQFIEPSKQYAHMIIPEGSNDIVIDLLITKIESIVERKRLDILYQL